MIIRDVDNYLKLYLQYETESHLPCFQEKHKKKSKILRMKTVLRIVRNKMHRVSINKYDKDFKQKNPYILCILTKCNHWYSRYANPELLDRESIVRKLWLNMPSGYDLVLTSHPRVKCEPEIEECIAKLPDCYICYGKPSSVQLIRDAKIVISMGSTAVTLALMQKKHIIELGKRSSCFNFDDAPVKRVEDLSKLKIAFEECLNEKTPDDKIYAYIYSFLQNSVPYNNKMDEIAFKRGVIDEHSSKRMLHMLVERLREDRVVL